jgi:hypothetical protein
VDEFSLYDNMRAFIPNKKKQKPRESDTRYIRLVGENAANNNGNVGVWDFLPGFIPLIRC